MDNYIKNKLESLKSIIGEWESCVIAFSGGCDSSLLLHVAVDTLGKGNIIAVTAKSPSFPEHELEEARKIVSKLQIEHVEFSTNELDDPNFFANPTDRCYYCKRELFEKVLDIAQKHGIEIVADASNFDDAENDYRPGLIALKEFGIRSPLKEAGLSKADVRAVSKELGLPTHKKPSFACLASRFPYGEEITAEKLDRVGKAENILRKRGFIQFRVRSHGNIARIELGLKENTRKFMALKADIVRCFKDLGYLYVTLDLEGYRSGSMNAAIGEKPLTQDKY